MQLKSSLISFNHHFDSPVIPTERKPKLLIINILGFFYILNWRDFGEMFFGFLSFFKRYLGSVDI